jgi:uncharacterized repeat protein (TIGR04042 family)
MPEMHFEVEWPDGRVERCYSPSLVVREHLDVGRIYPVSDFVGRVGTALEIASERVRQKYGFACSMAMDQLAQIESTASNFSAGDPIRIVAFDPEVSA